MLRIPLAVGALLVAIYFSVLDESHSLGMWGDFSMHAERARALANVGKSEHEEQPSSEVNCTDARVRSRKKRYVTFPSGSSSSLAICLSMGVPDTNLIFTHGFGYGISFELPNDTKTLRGGGGGEGGGEMGTSRELDTPFEWNENFPAKRRDRRTLYEKIEYALEQFGLDGRACILRTLCEVAQRITSKGTLIQEFVRIIFTMPQLERPHSWEGWDWDQEQSKDYDEAHLKGRNNPHIDCSYHFPGCAVSLLQYLIT